MASNYIDPPQFLTVISTETNLVTVYPQSIPVVVSYNYYPQMVDVVSINQSSQTFSNTFNTVLLVN